MRQEPIRSWRGRALALVERPVERLLALDRLNRIWGALEPASDAKAFLDDSLRALGVDVRVDPADVARVPETGPVLALANHPFGAVEGLAVAAALMRRRPDLKVLGNHLLGRIPELREILIAVDAFGGDSAQRANVGPMRAAMRWLQGGGALLVFPAGEVSHLDLRRRTVSDPPWNASLARLIRRAEPAVVPVFVCGRNGALFQLAGLVHPRLRTAMLPRELLNKRGTTIELRVGTPLRTHTLARLQSDAELMDHLRFRTYLLAERGERRRRGANRRNARRAEPEPTAEPAAPEAMAREIDALPPERRLAANGELTVIEARAGEIRQCLHEIGRLRELAFREAGEGTGRALDLDAFDEYYTHLLLWNAERREIAGAYRCVSTEDVLPSFGARGLYTSTLFDCAPGFYQRMGPALELGRSFVRAEYQRTYTPLLLLWKGIGRLVLRDPRLKTLFGAVSISDAYGPLSRLVMVMGLQSALADAELARYAEPRNPPRLRRARIDRAAVGPLEGDVEQIGQVVSDLEPDGKGIPILLREYLKLGGRVVGFNVDLDFNAALDALVVIDLTRTEPRVLARYLTPEGARAFLAAHA